MNDEEGHFWSHNSLIKELVKSNFKDPNTKMSKEGLKTYCHFLELFVEEGARRAEIQFLNSLESENTSTSEKSIDLSTTHTIEFENLEQIFVQLLLDF